MPNDSPAVGVEAKSWTDCHWTSRDGLSLYYRDYAGPADAPPILCLHGLTRNSRDFGEFAERYAGAWRIIVPDFRGRGLSDRDPVPAHYLPTTYAADVVQLLDELAIEQAVFVGTSLGGLVTMLIAATRPQRIAATVLNDIGPELDQSGIDRIRTYVGRAVRFRDWDEVAEYMAGVSRRLPASNSHDDWLRAARRVAREDGDAIIFDYDLAIAEPFNQRNDGGATFDLWPLFHKLEGAPLLIVRGELSDLLSPSAAQAMVEAHPDAELATVPGVGHAPELHEPKAVAAIDRLLAKVARAGRSRA
ncbi:MAG: alpha/beta hydrolase [Sphingomicrobium sp.]